MSLTNKDTTIRAREAFSTIARGGDVVELFPKEMREELRDAEDITIAEIADRDSIAASLKAVKDHGIKELLPVADDIPPQYGNLNKAFNEVFWLKKEAEKYGAKIHDLVFLESDEIYNILTTRYSKELIKHYGFFAPCMSCHLYFHTIRVPLVRALGGTRVVGGERNSHDGRMKVSQIPIAIDYYKKAVEELGGELVLPIRDIESTEEIIQLSYKENPQLSCMFKEMYGNIPQSIMENEGLLKKFLSEFAVPLDLKVINELTSKPVVDLTKVSDEYVESLLDGKSVK